MLSGEDGEEVVLQHERGHKHLEKRSLLHQGDDRRGSETEKLAPMEIDAEQVNKQGIGEDGNEPLPGYDQRVLLFVTYSCVIFSGGSIPSLSPSLKKDLGLNSGDMSGVLAAQTAGVATGKVLAGLVSDALGAKRGYLYAMSVVGFLVLCLSMVGQLWQLCVIGFSMEMAGALVWPAHAKFVQGNWPKHGWPVGFWILSMSSRGSDLSTKLVYGGLVRAIPWRNVPVIAAGIAAFGAFVSRFHADPTGRVESQPMSFEQAKSKLGKAFGDRRFWISVVPMALLTLVKRVGQLSPIYFKDTCQSLISEGEATQYATVYPVGLFTSTLIGGRLYRLLEYRGRMLLCTGLQTLSIFATFGLAMMPQESTTELGLYIRAALLFSMAFGIGTTYYIPLSVVSAKIGGDENTGMIAALLDCFSFIFAGSSLVGFKFVLQDPDMGWTAMWTIVGFVNVVAIFAVMRFLVMMHEDEPSYNPVSTKESK